MTCRCGLRSQRPIRLNLGLAMTGRKYFLHLWVNDRRVITGATINTVRLIYTSDRCLHGHWWHREYPKHEKQENHWNGKSHQLIVIWQIKKDAWMNYLYIMFAVTLSSSVESSELFLKAIRHLWLLHCFPVQFDSQQNSHAWINKLICCSKYISLNKSVCISA